MPRNSKPSQYAVTVEDVAQVTVEHAHEWGATAYYVITLGKPTGPAAYVEVTLREGVFQPAGKELARVRYPLDGRHVERWPGQMLYAVMAVYDALRNDPWNWPEVARRRVVEGEM